LNPVWHWRQHFTAAQRRAQPQAQHPGAR
jgi:hypothetical protein